MLKPEFTAQFKKDYKRVIKRGCNRKELEEIITSLCNQETLPDKYKDHDLVNSKGYKNVRECHIEPDWLLVYKVLNTSPTLKLIRTGSHSDLF